jgi:hypothetical protein
MKLRGKRILINIPIKKESALELTEKDKSMIEDGEMKKWTQLQVHCVGTTVEEIKKDDLVYLTISSVQNAERVFVDGDIKLMVSEGDIAIIW